MSDELDFAREAVTSLLERNPGELAWTALARDGWLDTLPEATEWDYADTVAVVLDCIAARPDDVPLAPHLAAAALLADAGRTAPGDRLCLLTDLTRAGDQLIGRIWGAADGAVAVVAWDERLLTVPVTAITLRADTLLGPVGVQWATLDARTVDAETAPLNSEVVSRHAAVVAWMLAVEAGAAVHGATQQTLQYIKQRRQFGAPLANHQALQHRAVDMYARSALATALVARATDAWKLGAPAGALSWASKSYVARHGVWTVENAIQLHGGIGFTWELGLHIGLRRVQRARQLLGGQADAGAAVIAAWRETAAEGPAAIVDWTLREASSSHV